HHRDVRAAVRERRFALRCLAGILEHPLRIPGAARPLSPRRARRGGGAAVPVPALVPGGADARALVARRGARAARRAVGLRGPVPRTREGRVAVRSAPLRGVRRMMRALRVVRAQLSPSLLQVIEHVRKGTLDFVLLKPADAQLLVSLSKIEPWRVIDVAGGGVILGVAFQRIGHPPALADVLLAALLLCSAVLVLYSIAILVVS